MANNRKLVECNVCWDDLPFSKVVECLSCNKITCISCVKTYITSNTQTAHCYNCKTGWDYKFLISFLPKTWVNGTKEGCYRAHRKDVALGLEKSKLPETMQEIPQIKAREKKKILLRDYKLKLSDLKDVIRKLEDEIWRDGQGKLKVTKTTFMCPCPRDECRGMIHTINFKCAVCEKGICRSCREPRDKGDKHKCDKNTIESVKLIRSDSKPCPKCATLIFKIAGCFDPETPILLYLGKIITAKDITVGDILLGDDGLARVV